MVKCAKAFVDAAKANPRSKKIQPGFYKLRKQMRGRRRGGAAARPDGTGCQRVTIPEGMTFQDIFKRLSEATEASRSPTSRPRRRTRSRWRAGLVVQPQDGKQVAKSIEGFLFPATYEFDAGRRRRDAS